MIKGISSNNTPTPSPLSTPTNDVPETLSVTGTVMVSASPTPTNKIPTKNTTMYTAAVPTATPGINGRNEDLTVTVYVVDQRTISEYKTIVSDMESKLAFWEPSAKELYEEYQSLTAYENECAKKWNAAKTPEEKEACQKTLNEVSENRKTYFKAYSEARNKVNYYKKMIPYYKEEIKKLEANGRHVTLFRDGHCTTETIPDGWDKY